MVIGKIGPISEMGGIDSRESILIWVLLLLTPDFDLFWVENIPKVFTSLSPICYKVYVQLCNKLQWGKLSHFDRTDSRWDFIWIFIWINFAFFARGSARERFEVAGQWILNQNLWICQNSDSDERERWILWHVPGCLNVWRWKMWPPLSIADSSRHNTCVCGLVISSRLSSSLSSPSYAIFPSRNDLDNVCGMRQMRKISVPWNWSNFEHNSKSPHETNWHQILNYTVL